MGHIILYIIILLLGLLLFKVVYDSQKKHNWFNKLKPNEKIIVKIFSENCGYKEAFVIKESDGKFIEAKLSNEAIEKCTNCAELNSKNKKGQITCWYKVTMFPKEYVDKTNFDNN